MSEAKPAEPETMEAQPATDDPTARRRHARVRASKAAKIICPADGKIYNCLILDESPGGVLVELGGLIALPEDVTIEYSNSAMFRAIRRQTNGTKVGFQFAGSETVSPEVAKELQAISKLMETRGLAAAAEALRASHFFNSHELRRLTANAEAATAQLALALSRKRSG